MTIVASFHEDTWRVRLTLSELPDGLVRVERSRNLLFWEPVRGGDELPVVGGLAVLDDWDGYAEGVLNHYRVAILELEGLMEVFDATGTWNKPPGLIAARVRAQAPGGGGAGAAVTAAGNVSVGEGGSGGEFIEAIIPASALGASETVTINAAGSGGVGLSGNSGGTVSFGAHIIANGGTGGDITSGSTTLGASGPAGGTGGTVPAEGFSIPGGRGAGAWRNGGSNLGIPGAGGDSQMGTGGPADMAGSSGFSGNPGVGFGSGGSGAVNLASQGSTRTGGNGAPGRIVVENIFWPPGA